MLTYLNIVKKNYETLKSMSVHIDDMELDMDVLNGLTSMYERFIVALDDLGIDDDSFTYELVQFSLLQEEQSASERESQF